MKISSHALRVIIASAGMCLAASGASAAECSPAQTAIGMQTFGENCVVPNTGDHFTPGNKPEDGTKDYKAPEIVGANGVAWGWESRVGSKYEYDATPVYVECGGNWTPTGNGQCVKNPSDTSGSRTCPQGSVLDGDVCSKPQTIESYKCVEGTATTDGKCTGYKPVKAGTALGSATSVQADYGTAVGAGATVGEGHTGSTAIGAAASTTKDHQVMIGTAGDTITAPGVTMRTGRGIGIVTIDAEGNLANDGGEVYETLGNHEGRITAAEGNIVTIKTDLGALQGTVGEHGVVLNDHGQRIGTLETTVDGHQVVLNDHGQRIGTLEGVAVNHEGRITAAEGKNTQQDKTLASHDGRITKVQGQADATDNRLNKYNGTGNTIEHWSSGVDMWREEAAYTLSNHGSRLNALEDWRNIAEGQIASLQGDVKRLQKTIAVATAITIPHVDHGKRFALTVSGAGVDGEGAGAIAAALRFNDTAQGFVGAGTSFSGGATAVKGGVTFQW